MSLFEISKALDMLLLRNNDAPCSCASDISFNGPAMFLLKDGLVLIKSNIQGTYSTRIPFIDALVRNGCSLFCYRISFRCVVVVIVFSFNGSVEKYSSFEEIAHFKRTTEIYNQHGMKLLQNATLP